MLYVPSATFGTTNEQDNVVSPPGVNAIVPVMLSMLVVVLPQLILTEQLEKSTVLESELFNVNEASTLSPTQAVLGV